MLLKEGWFFSNYRLLTWKPFLMPILIILIWFFGVQYFHPTACLFIFVHVRVWRQFHAFIHPSYLISLSAYTFNPQAHGFISLANDYQLKIISDKFCFFLFLVISISFFPSIFLFTSPFIVIFNVLAIFTFEFASPATISTHSQHLPLPFTSPSEFQSYGFVRLTAIQYIYSSFLVRLDHLTHRCFWANYFSNLTLPFRSHTSLQFIFLNHLFFSNYFLSRFHFSYEAFSSMK